jgi:hypothetical protein
MIIFQRQSNFTNVRQIFSRGAGGSGGNCPHCPNSVGAAWGNRLPFLPELHFEIRALFGEIGIYNYF